MKTITAVAAFSLLAASTGWAGLISADHPDGILCPVAAKADRQDGLLVFYLSAVLSDGRVLYQTLGNNVLSVTFDPSGTPVVDSGANCGGKSLSELTADGQSFGN